MMGCEATPHIRQKKQIVGVMQSPKKAVFALSEAVPLLV